jgi:hypothetical protein
VADEREREVTRLLCSKGGAMSTIILSAVVLDDGGSPRIAARQERRAAGVDHAGARRRMSNMIRQTMALLDESQSRDNDKHRAIRLCAADRVACRSFLLSAPVCLVASMADHGRG